MKTKVKIHEFDVIFDTTTLIYTVLDEVGNVVKESKSEEAVLKYCDNPEPTKKKKKVAPIPIFKIGWNDAEITKGNITSIAGEDRWSKAGEVDVWTNIQGSRSKERNTSLYFDNEENATIMTLAKEQHTIIKEAEERMRKIKNKLLIVPEKFIKNHFKED